MQKTMRLMKIYQIQKNYQKHRQRLLSLQSLDNKTKLRVNVKQNINKINTYKNKRQITHNYHSRSSHLKINQQNRTIRDKMKKIYNRQAELGVNKMLKVELSRRSLRSLDSVILHQQKLHQQNKQLRQRIKQRKSNYLHRLNKLKGNTQAKIFNKKEELIFLLQKQLKMQPTVTFPKIHTQSSSSPVKNHKKKILKNEFSFSTNQKRNGKSQSFHKYQDKNIRKIHKSFQI